MIVYELETRPYNQEGNYKMRDCLFGSVKLTKNADPDKCRCSGYGIRFYARSTFEISDDKFDEDFAIFDLDVYIY